MFEAGAGSTRIRIRSLWFLLLYASDALAHLRTAEREKIVAGERDIELSDAIGEVLVGEIGDRLHSAMAKGYRDRTESLTRVRGRVDHLRTAASASMSSGRIHCRYSELTFDLPRYRYMLVTLGRAARSADDPELRRRMIAMASRLEHAGVLDRDPTPAELSREQFGFNDSADRKIIGLCWLVRQMSVPEHQAGDYGLPIIRRDEGALRRLFERAVRGYYEHSLGRSGWSVDAPEVPWLASGDDLEQLPRLKTDVVLTGGSDRRLVVECKFGRVLTRRFGVAKVHAGYLRQLYVYADLLWSGDEIPTEGVLVAAKTEGPDEARLDAVLNGIPIRVREVDLQGDLSSIRGALDEAVGVGRVIVEGTDVRRAGPGRF